jgi:hypothetical protein
MRQMQKPSLYGLSVNLRIYDILLVTRVLCIISTKERIGWRRMKGSIETDENSFPTEISSILKIDHRTTNGVC